MINFYEIRWSSSGYPVWRSKAAAYAQCDSLFLPYSYYQQDGVGSAAGTKFTQLSAERGRFFKPLTAWLLPVGKEITVSTLCWGRWGAKPVSENSKTDTETGDFW